MVHSTCPLVPMVRLVPMDLHLVDGVPLVKCKSLYRLRISLRATVSVEVHSTHPLELMV